MWLWKTVFEASKNLEDDIQITVDDDDDHDGSRNKAKIPNSIAPKNYKRYFL